MITRRQFLKSLSLGAASGLLLPLIRYVSANDSAPLARRFVIVVEGNGVEPVNLLSAPTRARIEESRGSSIGKARSFNGAYGGFTTPEVVLDSDLATARSLGPLGPAGLNQDAAVVLGLSSTITGGGHTSRYGALGCMRSNGLVPAGPTIDAILAALPGVRGIAGGRGISPFDAFRAGIGQSGQTANGLCAYSQGNPAPLFMSQSAAFSHLFSSVAGGEAGRMFNTRNKMLDYASRDIQRTLQKFSGSSPERAKIESYLKALEDIEERQALLASPEWADRLRMVRPQGPGEAPLAGRPAFETSAPLEVMDLHFDMATAALLGGLTNVAVLASGVSGGLSTVYETVAPPGVDEHQRHKICHLAYTQSADLPGNNTDNPYATYLQNITAKHVDLIARMAKTLKDTPEGDGTSMLDHTLILFMSDNGEIHHASGKEWPMLLVGGKALGFQTDGRSVVYPTHGRAGYRQVSNMFNALGHAGGDDAFDTFGQESDAQRQAPGPVFDGLWKATGA